MNSTCKAMGLAAAFAAVAATGACAPQCPGIQPGQVCHPDRTSPEYLMQQQLGAVLGQQLAVALHKL